jgi:signal peptidase I
MHRNTRRLLLNLGTAALAVLAVVGYLLFAPEPLGGPVSYVITDGISMEPELDAGDLVIVRDAPVYRVGDVAAYQSESLDRVVLHRIIRVDSAGFVFRGDNNDFIDQDRPGADEILGKKWLVIPGGGKVLAWIGNPLAATVLAFAIASVIFFAFRARARRSRERSSRPATPRPSPVPGARSRLLSPAVAGIAVFAAMGAFGFAHPLTRAGHRNAAYVHRGNFEYEAKVGESAVYPSGRVITGQPLFVNLVDDVEVRFDYRLDTGAATALGGSSSMVAVLSSPSGWTHSETIRSRAEFNGDRVNVVGSLNLSRLAGLIDRVQQMTEVQETPYTLTIRPEVRIAGEVAGRSIDERFSPALEFEVDLLKARLATNEALAEDIVPADSLNPKATGSVPVPISQPNQASVGPLDVRIGVLRLIAVSGAVLCALLVGTLFLIARRVADEPSAIAKRYGRWMIAVETLRPTSERTAVEVKGMDQLVALAESYGRLILHQEDDGIHSYVVEESNIAYWYQAFVTTPLADSNVRSLPARSSTKHTALRGNEGRHRAGDGL